VGRALGWRLRDLGWRIGAVVTRSKATARAAVRKINGGEAFGAPTRQVLAADVVIIATPDDAITRVAGQLARLGGSEWRGKVVLHTSGALDREALCALAQAGAATGSIHPLQTFSGRAVPELEGVVIAIEGDRRALRVARSMARALGGIPVRLAGRDKPAYHAAGALVAGHGLALVEAATQVLMKIGFTRRQAARALLPLIRQMLVNFERLGPRLAWTGPLSRGDYSTITRHARVFRTLPQEYGDAYAALSLLGGRVLSANSAETRARIRQAWGGPKGGRT